MKLPDLSFERKIWKKGFKVLAGADEVGRGAFAGPVVASTVAFAPRLTVNQLSSESVKINDSKKLTPKQREAAEGWIKKNAFAWGIGEASAAAINRHGIKKASEIAFRKAITDANRRLMTNDQRPIGYLLVDAFYVPYVRGLPKGVKGRKSRQLAIIDGDQKSISIAAASIIAKVYRDRLMTHLSKKFKKYAWDKNKGYGTQEHQESIKKYGLSKYHRIKFVSRFFSSPAR